jgi:SNF2 family DNA or RNA helicase
MSSSDDMGLGKTVQMIALMAINGPKVDSRARQTLIVVPAALVQQVSLPLCNILSSTQRHD